MKKREKKIFIFSIIALVVIGVVYLLTNNQLEMPDQESSFIECLKDAGVVIYGSQTCPACSRLEEEYGGYEIIKPIYVDCSGIASEEDFIRCQEEIQTGFVPEIQIRGEVLDEWGSPQVLSEITGCQI